MAQLRDFVARASSAVSSPRISTRRAPTPSPTEKRARETAAAQGTDCRICITQHVTTRHVTQSTSVVHVPSCACTRVHALARTCKHGSSHLPCENACWAEGGSEVRQGKQREREKRERRENERERERGRRELRIVEGERGMRRKGRTDSEAASDSGSDEFQNRRTAMRERLEFKTGERSNA
eukprot:6200109-Pleurochrysis_carterae.AAC.2